ASSWSLVGRGFICAPSGASGIGGLDRTTQECVIGGVLFCGGTDISALHAIERRRRFRTTALVFLLLGAAFVCGCATERKGYGLPASGIIAGPLVEEDPS